MFQRQTCVPTKEPQFTNSKPQRNKPNINLFHPRLFTKTCNPIWNNKALIISKSSIISPYPYPSLSCSLSTPLILPLPSLLYLYRSLSYSFLSPLTHHLLQLLLVNQRNMRAKNKPRVFSINTIKASNCHYITSIFHKKGKTNKFSTVRAKEYSMWNQINKI